MPYGDPAVQIAYQKTRARARQRALRRLSRLHWEEFERILSEELEKAYGPTRGEEERHKIVEQATGGGHVHARCLCGWGFGANDQRVVDAAAAAHSDGEAS
jgi:hypothetical protein